MVSLNLAHPVHGEGGQNPRFPIDFNMLIIGGDATGHKMLTDQVKPCSSKSMITSSTHLLRKLNTVKSCFSNGTPRRNFWVHGIADQLAAVRRSLLVFCKQSEWSDPCWNSRGIVCPIVMWNEITCTAFTAWSSVYCLFYQSRLKVLKTRGIAMASRLSVCPWRWGRPCRDHISWKSSKKISRFASLGCSLSSDPNIAKLEQQ